VKRAEQVLKRLEASPDAVDALPLFAAAEEPEAIEITATHPALDLLNTIDPDTLTPREALDLIYKLKDHG
jgi:DNA mismatch repair protein MutS